MISRRHFLALGALAAIASRALAQSRRARIGVLGPSPLETSLYAAAVVQAFAQVGYAEGARATFLYRYAEGGFDQYRRQAQDLAGQDCDLVIAIRSEPAARALQFANLSVPVLFLAIDYDPLASGVVSNLRNPDRRTTGDYVPQNVLVARRVEIMRELVPEAKRLMVFADRYSADQVEAARKAAAGSRFQLMLVQFVNQPYDYRIYFEDKRGIEGVAFMSLASPIFARDRGIIQEALTRLRVPGIGSNPLQAEKGYLLTLGSNVPRVAKRVADMGVRLLAGTSPSAVPVELADEFELVINNGTAQALGIRIPDAVRARAARILA